MMLSRLSFLAPTRGPAAAIMRQSLLGSSVLAVQHQPRTTTRTPSAAAATPEHPWSSSPQQQQQVRFRRGWAFTKQRLKRQARYERRKDMRERGIPIPKPPMYLPRDTPVVNAQTDEERRAAVQAQDEAAVAELHDKLRASREKELLRFHMTGLRMSERVRKLFDLHNGNQKEVIKAQKQKGMEVFQLREGDTGSSAVQGACVCACLHEEIEYSFVLLVLHVLGGMTSHCCCATGSPNCRSHCPLLWIYFFLFDSDCLDDAHSAAANAHGQTQEGHAQQTQPAALVDATTQGAGLHGTQGI